MKSLEFIYQESEIHFLVNGTDKNVMINATEMAQIFGKRIDVFLKADHTKRFIETIKNNIEFPPYGGNSGNEIIDSIIQTKGQSGTYFHRALALKFAAWLDPEFEFWVFTKIEELVFGNYKKHWDAHSRQEEAREKMKSLRSKLLTNPTAAMVAEYFEAEADFKDAKNAKSNAIRNQLRLFGGDS